MRLRILLLLVLMSGPASAAEPHAYRCARLWSGSGPVISDAVLVVRDGKVVAGGKRANVAIPADAIIHDLGDTVIIPGLVIAETTLADKGRDDLLALTPHYRAADGFDPYADYSTVLAGGVTTVQIAPGGKRLLPGQGSVVKLHGSDPAKRVLREEESLRVVLGDAFKNPPRVYEPPVGPVSVDRPLEPTRPQIGGGLPGAMAGLRATVQAARVDQATTDPFLKAVGSAGTREKPLRVTAPGAADVHAALSLGREFDLQLILVDPPAPTPEGLSAWKGRVAGVVINPGMRPGVLGDVAAPDETAPAAPAGRRRRPNPTPAPKAALRGKATATTAKAVSGSNDSPAEVAHDLRAAGVRVAIKPVVDADLKEMLYLGGLFTTHNPAADVLAMVTADAAAMLGVSDRVGSLTPGHDADFVILSGDPFALHTRVRAVYVDGERAFDASTQSQRKVIRGARVWTGVGEPIANGGVLVDGKTIRAVGRDVGTPADAEDKRFAGAVIVPGFIDLANGLGVGGPLSSSVPLNTKLGQRLVAGEPGAAIARQGGITTVLLSGPAPSPVVAFKLGDKLRPIADPVALRFAVRGNLTAAAGTFRDALKAGKEYHERWLKYEGDLKVYEQKKKEYDAAKPKEPEKKADEKKTDDAKEEKKADDKKDDKAEAKKDDKKPAEKKPEEPKAPTKPPTVEAMEPYRILFAGKIPVLVEAQREDAIRLAVAISRDEFNLRTILVGADDAWRVADLLAEKSVAVVAGPELVRTVEGTEVNLPLSVVMRGLPVGFQSKTTAAAKNLPLAVGLAVRHGLGTDDALRGLSAGPANFLGLDSIGSLAVGKDADLVVLSGNPFELSTRVLAVMIDGQWVWREE